MSTLRFKINVPGFNQARNDPRILAELHSMGESIAAAAGGAPDFVVNDAPNATRARVVVIAATAKAKRAEAKHRTLTKALDAGRR
jgi:N-formylglutamate amidohydrolase